MKNIMVDKELSLHVLSSFGMPLSEFHFGDQSITGNLCLHSIVFLGNLTLPLDIQLFALVRIELKDLLMASINLLFCNLFTSLINVWKQNRSGRIGILILAISMHLVVDGCLVVQEFW
jgi:hypothetical protein